jgi:hypothetical protein
MFPVAGNTKNFIKRKKLPACWILAVTGAAESFDLQGEIAVDVMIKSCATGKYRPARLLARW